MDWTEINSLIRGQESIFWVAAISIATGATLLLASGLVLAKRGLVKGLMVSFKRVPKIPATENTVKLTDTGYSASTLTKVSTEASQPSMEDKDFQDLNARLKKAANLLEDIHRSLKNEDQLIGVSGLKGSLQDVEYVFKTGIG